VIVSVAVVPHPPLLVPELVAGAVVDTEQVRRACVAAGKRLAGASRDWLAIATDPESQGLTSADASGTFRGYGVDKIVSLSKREPVAPADPALPLPALIAGWLRECAGAARVDVHTVPSDLLTAECHRLGRRLAVADNDVGLLVLGDGSSRHPGPSRRSDDRAAGYDAAVRDALAIADNDGLLALDADLGAELDVSGRAAWQVLAGATADREWRADLLYSDAPYGVAYHVAYWEPV
jgi:hypothetical protein